MTFAELGLIDPLVRAVSAAKYTEPTPIQAKAIPPLLEGRDLLGCAQTGTGKTAAFALPVLQLLLRRPVERRRHIRALVLSPTRELAAQIGESFSTYGRYSGLRNTVIFGGVYEGPQIRTLRDGVDILVATPGRLLDLLDRRFVDLSGVEHFVLDEADRMLDMGFIRDIERVMAVLPRRRQNLLFSATMPQAIDDLARSFLDDPVSVQATPPSTPVDLIEQHVAFVDRGNKLRLLVDLLARPEVDRALVFTRTKRGADRVTRQLERSGINAAALHGDKTQGARTRALERFRDGKVPVLVATDIAARGWDVDGISHVVNFELSNEPEVYIHRIGRTGRAGKSGIAICFCDATEGENLRAIERHIGRSVPVFADHDYHCEAAVPPPARPPQAKRNSVPPWADRSRSGQGDRTRSGQSDRPRSGQSDRTRSAHPDRTRSAQADRTRSPHPDRSPGAAAGPRSNGSQGAERRPPAEGLPRQTRDGAPSRDEQAAPSSRPRRRYRGKRPMGQNRSSGVQ